MSLNSYNFTLLPRPTRSPLSFANESQRAILPDFATVGELSAFVTRFFYYDLTYVPGVYIQMKTSMSFLCVCVVLAVLVVMRRMYERTFWIIRVVKRPTGRVLVPNSLLCFAIIEGVYALGCVALVWATVYTSELHIMRPFLNPLWILLPWCPLYFGAIWATWGTFFATPSQLRHTANPGPKSTIRRFFDNAVVTNCAGLLLPVIVCLSVIIPACFSAVYFKFAQRRHDRWLSNYDNMDVFTQSMVIDAQLIWFEMLKSNRLVSIVLIVWACWGALLWIAYNVASLRLIKVIRSELRRSEEGSCDRYGIISTINANAPSVHQQLPVVMLAPQIRPVPSTASFASSNRVKHDGSFGAEVTRHPFTFFQSGQPTPVAAPSSIDEQIAVNVEALARKEVSASFMHRLQNVHRARAVTSIKAQQRSADSSHDYWSKNRLSTTFEDTHADGNAPTLHEKRWTLSDIRLHWRHYMPNIVMQTNVSSMQESVHVAREAHIKNIGKAYIHICVQYLTICPSILGFTMLAAGLGALFFGATETPFRGGTMFEPVLAVGITLVFWLNIVAGMATYLALVLRTYEPVLSGVQLSGLQNRQNQATRMGKAVQARGVPTDYANDPSDQYASNFLHMTSLPAR